MEKTMDDKCKFLSYKHPDESVTDPVKCKCSKYELYTSPHYGGKGKGSDAKFMTLETAKKRRAFKKIFKGHKKKIKNAIKSLNIPEQSCYECCNEVMDEYKNKHLNTSKQTDITKTDAYGWVINEVTPFEGGTGEGDVDNTSGKKDSSVFCNWSGYYGGYNKQYLHKRADAYVCGCDASKNYGDQSTRTFAGESDVQGCMDQEKKALIPAERTTQKGNPGTWFGNEKIPAAEEYHQHDGYERDRGHGPKFPKEPPSERKVGGHMTMPAVVEGDNVWIESMKNIENQQKLITKDEYRHRNRIQDKVKVMYVNELKGNDKYGDGSIYNPYKTVAGIKKKFIEIDYIIKESGSDEDGIGTDKKPFKSLQRVRKEIQGKNNVVVNVVVFLPDNFKLVEGVLIIGAIAAAGAAYGIARAMTESVTGDHSKWGGCWPVQSKRDEEALVDLFRNKGTTRGSTLVSEMADGWPIAGIPSVNWEGDSLPMSQENKNQIRQCPTFGVGGMSSDVAKKLKIPGDKDYSVLAVGVNNEKGGTVTDVRQTKDIDSWGAATGGEGKSFTKHPDTNRMRFCKRPPWQNHPYWKMRCCLDPTQGNKDGIFHHLPEGQTCPKDYCYSYMKLSGVPNRNKVMTELANGGLGTVSQRSVGVDTAFYDPHKGPLTNCDVAGGTQCSASQRAMKGTKLLRIMTKECHENFKTTCLEPWAPDVTDSKGNKRAKVKGGHFFGGSNSWMCAENCDPKRPDDKMCGQQCRDKMDQEAKAGGRTSPISNMCRKWAQIQPSTFDRDVAPKICKIPSKSKLESDMSLLQEKSTSSKGAYLRDDIRAVLEFPLCRDYIKRHHETFKVPLMNLCTHMYKRKCSGGKCTYDLKYDKTWGWRPKELNGELGKMLFKSQACECHYPEDLRRAILEKRYKGHMKPMIAFKLEQNRHCADKSCSVNGLGPPQSFLNSIDKCLCNLNIQICNQDTGEDVKDEEEPTAESGTNFWNRPRTPKVKVQVCKFSGASAGISNDDWTAMHQCGVDQNRMAIIKKLSEKEMKRIEKKADEILNPLKSGSEKIMEVGATVQPTPSQADTSLESKRLPIIKGVGKTFKKTGKGIADISKKSGTFVIDKTEDALPIIKIAGVVIVIIIIVILVSRHLMGKSNVEAAHLIATKIP